MFYKQGGASAPPFAFGEHAIRANEFSHCPPIATRDRFLAGEGIE
jgi:hypothetical protein